MERETEVMVDDAEELAALLVTWTKLLAWTKLPEAAELPTLVEEEIALMS
jgi:hypothetical protein